MAKRTPIYARQNRVFMTKYPKLLAMLSRPPMQRQGMNMFAVQFEIEMALFVAPLTIAYRLPATLVL
jgi:hypothetical protein